MEYLDKLGKEYASAFGVDYDTNKEFINDHLTQLKERGGQLWESTNVNVYLCKHANKYTIHDVVYCNSCHKRLGYRSDVFGEEY